MIFTSAYLDSSALNFLMLYTGGFNKLGIVRIQTKNNELFCNLIDMVHPLILLFILSSTSLSVRRIKLN